MKFIEQFNRIKFKAQKASPTALVVMGVVGFGTTIVLACRASFKAKDILEEHAIERDAIETASANVSEELYPAEEKQKDVTELYVNTGLQLAKTYAPTVLVGVASVASVLGGHHILSKRNAALVAAYAVLDQSFKGYRDRVIEKFGEEADFQLKHALRAEKDTVEEVDEETGKKKKVKREIMVADGYSQYARFFDDACDDWIKNDPEHNLNFVRMQQNWANDKLKRNGHLFLNEVYDMLGIPRTQAGQIVGWVDNGDGDNYVDFGIYNIHRQENRDFVNGYEDVILLDFNVDGPIWNLI